MGEVMEFYKPIKKPVTLRLDADVLAWFKRDGRRYQTRINAALRRMMEREMKETRKASDASLLLLPEMELSASAAQGVWISAWSIEASKVCAWGTSFDAASPRKRPRECRLRALVGQ